MRDCPFTGLLSHFAGCRPVRCYTAYFMFVGAAAQSRPHAICPVEAGPGRRWAGYD